MSSVRVIRRYLSKDLDRQYNLFEVVTEKEFNEIMNLIHSNENTLNKYKSGNHQYSRGIKLYQEFLTSNEAKCKSVKHIIDEGEFLEGQALEVTLTKYERNREARRICLAQKGTSCAICRFNAAEVYGERFKGKIHVHHVVPISEIAEEYLIDIEEDLVPVCANCHMIIHSKNPPYTIEEVNSFYNSSSSKKK